QDSLFHPLVDFPAGRSRGAGLRRPDAAFVEGGFESVKDAEILGVVLRGFRFVQAFDVSLQRAPSPTSRPTPGLFRCGRDSPARAGTWGAGTPARAGP